MLKIIFIGIAAFLTASLHRIVAGPSSPGWSWRLEWIVAVQRAVLEAMIDWPPKRIRDVMVGRMGPLARKLELTKEELGGVLCERVQRPGTMPESHLLYFHGGGFTLGSIASHREIVAALTTHGNLEAHSVAYRQPPEDRFPAAVDDCVAAYRGLLDSGVRPERIAIAGDSAGGNLCLALMLRAKTRFFSDAGRGGLDLPGARHEPARQELGSRSAARLFDAADRAILAATLRRP